MSKRLADLEPGQWFQFGDQIWIARERSPDGCQIWCERIGDLQDGVLRQAKAGFLCNPDQKVNPVTLESDESPIEIRDFEDQVIIYRPDTGWGRVILPDNHRDQKYDPEWIAANTKVRGGRTSLWKGRPDLTARQNEQVNQLLGTAAFAWVAAKEWAAVNKEPFCKVTARNVLSHTLIGSAKDEDVMIAFEAEVNDLLK